MSRISTPSEWKEYCNAMRKEHVSIFSNPRKQTMAVILQFARSYHVEKQLPAELSGYVLN